MKTAIKVIWIITLFLSAMFVLFLYIGQQKAVNKMFFDETVFPGPIHVSYTSFPFAALSDEIEDLIHEYPFQRYFDIESVYYNRDTVYLYGEDKPIPIKERLFVVTNPVTDKEERINERIIELSELPDFRGRDYKHINLSNGFFILTGEILSLIWVCQLLLILVILYWGQFINKAHNKENNNSKIGLLILFSLLVLAIHGCIIHMLATH